MLATDGDSLCQISIAYMLVLVIDGAVEVLVTDRDDCHLPFHSSNSIFVLRVHLHARVSRLYALVSLHIIMR